MKRLLVVVLVAFAWLGCGHAYADSVLIAGSGGVAPPIFPGGFVQVVPSADRAVSFLVAPDSDYRVDELQVGVYRFPNFGGATAEFAIHADAAGAPGLKLVSFDISGIPLSSPGIVSETPNSDIVLLASAAYWLVGTTDYGQVNWSLAAGIPPLAYALRPNASNFNDAGWVVSQTGNVGTFAIFGTPVPEPGAALAGLIAALMACGESRKRM